MRGDYTLQFTQQRDISPCGIQPGEASGEIALGSLVQVFGDPLQERRQFRNQPLAGGDRIGIQLTVTAQVGGPYLRGTVRS